MWWALDPFEMCSCLMPRARAGSSPALRIQVGRLLFRAAVACCCQLVLWAAFLALPGTASAARVSSSLSTTHHVHHFHSKHGTVPIAINRMPFLTRGGHGTSTPKSYLQSITLYRSNLLSQTDLWYTSKDMGCSRLLVSTLRLFTPFKSYWIWLTGLHYGCLLVSDFVV